MVLDWFAEALGFNAPSAIELIFITCAVLGAAFFIVMMALMLVGDILGGVVDTAFDTDFSMDTDLSFELFSLQGIAAAIMMFGLMGLFTVSATGMELLAVIAGGFAAGGSLYMVRVMMQGISNLQADGTMRHSDAVGERGQGMIAQDHTKHPGSIIRINLDGSIPIDNPRFEGNSNWLPEIYQIGIRNPQGLSLSPFDGKIYMSNHGAKGGDWFGEVKKGENYGWKILGWGGKNYTGTKIGPKWKPGFTKAIQYWVPSIATSAISIYKGNEFKEWNSHALITSLKDKSLRKLIFDDKLNVKEEIIFKDKIGRIRDIQIHPNNGKIYFLAGDSLWLMEKN